MALESHAAFSFSCVLISLAGVLHAWAIFVYFSLDRLFLLLPPLDKLLINLFILLCLGCTPCVWLVIVLKYSPVFLSSFAF